MFSKACEYGIRAMIYLATHSSSKERAKIGDIAASIGSPKPFTAKILGDLVRSDIAASYTGPNGGFAVEEAQAKKTQVIDIVKAIDGDALFTNCALGLKECSSKNPCPIHEDFVGVRNDLIKTLEKTTLHDLVIGIESGKTILMK